MAKEVRSAVAETMVCKGYRSSDKKWRGHNDSKTTQIDCMLLCAIGVRRIVIGEITPMFNLRERAQEMLNDLLRISVKQTQR